MNKLPTMEITIDKNVDGRAMLELFDDHRAEGCFGVATSERSSQSKFASRDGKHHSDENRSRMLVAMHGTWTADADAIRVLHVKSEDGRRDHTPTVTFTAGNVELVESDFRD